MKLVGATDWFIRWPFVIEGIVVGAAGALLAIAVLGRDQDRAARSARQQLDADRGAADDLVHRAARRADGRRRAASRRSAPGCRCAASCACSAAGSLSRRAQTGAQLPWIAADVRAPSTFSPAGHWCSLGVIVLLIGVWFGGHPSWLPGPIRSAFVSQSNDDKLINQVLGLIQKRLLPQGRPLRSGQQGARGRGGEPQRQVLALLRPGRLPVVPEPGQPAPERDRDRHQGPAPGAARPGRLPGLAGREGGARARRRHRRGRLHLAGQPLRWTSRPR